MASRAAGPVQGPLAYASPQRMAEMSAGDVAARFEMTKPTVSHHFQVLKDADLVSTRREGTRIFYRLNTTVTQDLVRWMWDAFGQPEASGSSKPGSKKKA